MRRRDGFRHNGRVLLVEDDPLIAIATTEELIARGFEVHIAVNAEEALDRLIDGPVFDILFTDVHLADGIDGTVLARLARKIIPALAVVYTSAAADAVERAVPGSVFVPKPYLPDRLSGVLAELLVAA